MDHLRIKMASAAGETFEFEGDVTVGELCHLVGQWFGTIGPPTQAQVDALTARAAHSTDTLAETVEKATP